MVLLTGSTKLGHLIQISVPLLAKLKGNHNEMGVKTKYLMTLSITKSILLSYLKLKFLNLSAA